MFFVGRQCHTLVFFIEVYKSTSLKAFSSIKTFFIAIYTVKNLNALPYARCPNRWDLFSFRVYRQPRAQTAVFIGMRANLPLSRRGKQKWYERHSNSWLVGLWIKHATSSIIARKIEMNAGCAVPWWLANCSVFEYAFTPTTGLPVPSDTWIGRDFVEEGGRGFNPKSDIFE